RFRVTQQIQERDETAHAVAEEEPRHAGPPALRHGGKRAQVDHELGERPAVPAGPARPSVPTMIDRCRREPASGEMCDELAVAPEVLRVPVRDQDDAARGAGRGSGPLIIDLDPAGTGEGPVHPAGHAGAGWLRTRATASRQPW